MSAISTVYVESRVASHPRTRAVPARLPRVRVVSCERYGVGCSHRMARNVQKVQAARLPGRRQR